MSKKTSKDPGEQEEMRQKTRDSVCSLKTLKVFSVRPFQRSLSYSEDVYDVYTRVVQYFLPAHSRRFCAIVMI